MISLISYKVDAGFGFLCYSGRLDVEFFEKHFKDKHSILFISKLNENARKNVVSYFTGLDFEHKIIERIIANIEHVNGEWLDLCDQYDNPHILAVIPIIKGGPLTNDK